MWFALIRQYWQLIRFQRLPADTSYSPLLLTLVCFFYFILVVSQWLISDIEQKLSFNNALLIASALIISYLIYTYLVLFGFRFKARFVQTVTCLLAGHAIIHVLAFPLLLLTPLLIETNTVNLLGPFVAIIYLILTLILTIWQFMVTVYIYKHALSVDYLPAILASLGLLACNILVVSFSR